MNLLAGTKLGPYEIVAPLGAGGMGEVYRARDARLGRDVAIKALPPAFAQDPERLARFEREARLLASLNHPNVAGIHGVEEVEGARYLVLEFVDGETLEAHVRRGALSLHETLDVMRQVAAGVEAAHEAGVVHRDLKPGNIMLTANGGVKVLDFGLAKGGGGRGADSDPNLSASPTMTYGGTQAGVILGTAAYMSPEQARGKAVDRRTDIWSFGCVLFECLTGRRVYEGETVSDMVARILEREPDWSALPSGTPPRLIALLKRCMTKDARQRQRDVGDVRLELEAIAAGDTGAVTAASAATAPRRAPLWRAIAIAALLMAAGAALAWFMRGGRAEEPMSLSLLAPPGLSFGRNPSDLALSPDGRRVVFVGQDSLSGPRLWVRDLGRENSRVLAQTENASYPFWAPDGRRIGFFADGKLKTLSLESGAVATLVEAPLPRGGAWGRGVILFQPLSIGPLLSIPEAGGNAEVATSLDSAAGDVGHRFPQFLPDGRHFIASVLTRGDNKVAAGVLGAAAMKPLFTVTMAAGGTYASPGWIIAPREGAVKAQRFDQRSMRMTGPALPVPGLKVISPDANGSPVLSASTTGVLLQRAAIDLPQRLAMADRSGRAVADVDCPMGQISRGSFSPDGRLAVFEFTRSGEESQIWVADLVRGNMQPFTFEKGNYTPVFSPDSRRIAFTREQRGQNQDIWVMDADSPGSQRLVRLMPARFNTALSWAPDGSGVLLRTQGTETKQDLVFVPFDASDSIRVVAGSRFNEPVGAISPDGRWVAFITDESGQYECRVRALAAAGGPSQLVSRGAYADPAAANRIGLPVWRRDGRELLYVAADGRTFMAVDVTPGESPVFGAPRPLFRLPAAAADCVVNNNLDRFLLSITREDEGRTAATVLVHWTGTLEGGK